MKTPTERRQQTRETLIALAEAEIAANGLSALRARDLAKQAGIAVGAIYTHFKELDALVLEVNARTFRAIGLAVQAASDAVPEGDATGKLIAMSQAYHTYAQANTPRWQALFENRIVSEANVPEWYRGQVDGLFALIGGQLQVLRPDLTPQTVELVARGLFGSAHGIVALSIQSRISAVPADNVPEILEIMIRSATQVTQG